MKPIATAGALAIVLGVSLAQAQSPMREGRWEVTTQMDIPNMPMKMPAQKTFQCVTKEQIEKGSAVPGGPNAGQKENPCKTSDYKVSGNKVTWNMQCTGQQAMSGSGELVVDGDSYTGTMKMTSERGPMTVKYTAKRVGDCEQ